MKSRQRIEPAFPAPRYFDHHRSTYVDVTPHEDSEFVQVWDRPTRELGRRLLLTYRRTPTGPTDIASRFYPADGPWQLIETTGARRTFYYRGRNDFPRYEEALPSGEWLIDDFRAGLIIRAYWADSLDWDNPTPPKKELSDRALKKRQSTELPWYRLRCQETWVEDRLASSTPRLAEEYRGRQLMNVREYSAAGEPNPRLQPTGSAGD